MKTIYVTWDATTYGIRKAILLRKTDDNLGVYVEFFDTFVKVIGEFIPAEYWFMRHSAALKSAERQRQAKIKQLEGQIERLKNMEFK